MRYPSPLRPRSLKGQLIGLVAALGLPLIAIQGWSAYRESQAAVVKSSAESLDRAEANAERISQFLQQSEGLLQAAAGEFGASYLGQGEGCGASLAVLTSVFTFTTNTLIADADGSILCSARGRNLGGSAREWRAFAAVAAGAPIGHSPAILGQYSDEWILPVAAPIRDEQGNFIGALMGSIPLTALHELINVAREAETLVTVADDQRRVLARSIEPEAFVGTVLAPENGSDTPISPGRSFARGRDSQNVNRTWGQVEMENGWTVYVGTPAGGVLGPAQATLVRHLAVTFTVFLAALLLAAVFYRRIAGALAQLSRGVEASAQGEEIPLPDSTPDEVRAVAERFNAAARRLLTAQAAQADAGERYQSIFDNAVFGLYVSTGDGRFLQVNAAMVAMLGYESQEALLRVGPGPLYEDHGEREQLLARAALGEPITVETVWMKADGSPITVLLSGRRIQVGDEDAYEMIVQDITARRHVEDELRQSQKMEAIGKLAGGIAHDFNNLLPVIGGNTELIELGLPDDHPLQTDIAQVLEASQRATSLTTQLLAFSRKEPHGARTVDVHDVLVNMERMLARLIGEDMVLNTRLAADPSLISIDSGELEQVVMNLVLNARDAMPMGGRVTVETSSLALEIEEPGIDAGRQGILLSVGDTGEGMDSETTKRMFEPFYTTKPIGEGTGLGLSTVYGIVQRAGGQIRVRSEVGSGTTIELWFPLAARGLDRTPIDVSNPTTGGSERILVVEDEDLVRVFVRRALEEAGYEVVVAGDGQEALEVFDSLESPVDLVLTDVVMPRMKGPEMAEHLGRISPKTPILFMSGYIDNRVFSGQLAENPELLLRKPFSTAALHQRVRMALDQLYVPTP